MKINAITRAAFWTFFCLAPLLVGSAPAAAVLREGEALVTVHMPHDYSAFDAYCENAFPSACELADLIMEESCESLAEVTEVYPYLSFKGDLVFAHVKSEQLSTPELLAMLNADDRVKGACPNWLVRLGAVPDDPDLSRQWGMREIRAGDKYKADAWAIATGSPEVLVAVMDTGIDWLHSDIGANYRDYGGMFTTYGGLSIDTDGHGTHVAGIIGGVGDNGIGIAGVNWRVGLMSLKIIEHEGVGEVKNILSAIDHLVQFNDETRRVCALNMSFSYASDVPPQDMVLSPLYEAFKHLDEQNQTVMISAAGNAKKRLGVKDESAAAGTPGTGAYEYPACLPLNNIIVVGATDDQNRLFGSTGGRNGSNWDPVLVDILAPGERIWSTEPSNRYGNRSGTSMAAPHVAGAIALMVSVNPNLSASALKRIVLETANGEINPPGIGPHGVAEGIAASAHGMLDVRKALEQAARMALWR